MLLIGALVVVVVWTAVVAVVVGVCVSAARADRAELGPDARRPARDRRTAAALRLTA
jgi:hypothetical protein